MWARIVNISIGLWLIAVPGIFAYAKMPADNDHIVGPIVVTFSVVACWEATRGMRKWNFAPGLWLLLAPWVLSYDATIPIISDMVCGLLILIFASVRGKVEAKFGGGWSEIV